MPKRVRRKPNTRNMASLAKYRKVTLNISNGDLCIVFGTKKQGWGWFTPFSGSFIDWEDISEKEFAKVKRKCQKPIFTSFAVHPENERIPVYIFFRKGEKFGDAN